MENLNKETMIKMTGGGLSVWTIFGLGTLIVFLAGGIDGFARPFACHK